MEELGNGVMKVTLGFQIRGGGNESGQEIGNGFGMVFRFAILVWARMIPRKDFCARSFQIPAEFS